MGTDIDLIVGLGNPDPEYQATRHNAGFWFVDLLAREHGGSFSNDKKLHGQSAEVHIAGRRVRLLKPMTYMNLSGRSVAAAVNYYKVPLERVLVAHDELDFPPGRLQLRFGGGTAGHNGVRSVVEHLGEGFWRLRIGVGHPGDKARVIGHVLKRADAEEEQLILDAIADAVREVPTILELGAERAKNRLHSRKRPTPADERKES
ncbi:MAG TPA: aminoacyl-tRNA hydrolase [Gammaproteobacteria bacterium]